MITVAQLLSSPIMQDARVVAGSASLANRGISWVTVIEWPVEDFVRPDEVVLTSAVGCDTRMFEQLVRESANAGAAALCVGVGEDRYIEHVAPSTINFAEREEFPLIELPWELRFGDIIREVVVRVLERDEPSTGSTASVDKTFEDIIADGLGFDVIADALEVMIDRPVVILDTNLAFVQGGSRAAAYLATREPSAANSCQNLTPDQVRRISNRLSAVLPRYVADITDLGLPGAYTIAALSSRKPVGYVLALDPERRELSEVDARALSRSAVAIVVEFLRKRAAIEAEVRSRDQFLWSLATSAVRGDDASKKASLLGYRLQTSYRLVLIEEDAPTNARSLTHRIGTRDRADSLDDLRAALHRVAGPLRGELITARQDTALLALFEVGEHSNSVRTVLEEGLRSLPPPARSFTITISASGQPLVQLAHAYQAMRDAVALARSLFGPGTIADERELAPFQLLANLASDPEAHARARSHLAALLDYDEHTSRGLVHTLSVYLEENCNKSATARRLFLNRHSLLYRLKKIETLTGFSLDSPADRLLLELSLKLIEFKPTISGSPRRLLSPL